MKGIDRLKECSQLWDRADLDTSFLTLNQSSYRFDFRSILLDFQSFTEKPVFECPFAHSLILFSSYLVKKSIYRVSVICKSAMKWYLMRMCAS